MEESPAHGLSLVEGGKQEWNVRLLSPSEIFQWEGPISNILEETKELWEEFTTKDDIIHHLCENEFQFWIVRKGTECRFAFMTQVIKDAVQVFWAYGETSPEILHLSNECTQNLALMCGANRVEVHGRQGWVRKFKSWGFTLQKVVVSKPVVPRRMN